MSGNVRFDSISTSGFPLQTVEEDHRNKIRQYLHENRLGTNELILANDCVTNSIMAIFKMKGAMKLWLLTKTA